MRHTIIILAALFAIACKGGASNPTQTAGAERKLEIKIPDPPLMLTTAADKSAYVARNMWKDFDFTDTTYMNKRIPTEEAFGTFAAILGSVPPAEGAELIDSFMTRARANREMYKYFAGLASRFLYDPNSPYRNEDLYIAVLENMIAWNALEEVDKVRPRAELEVALKNRVGSVANNIEFALANGRRMTLHQVKAPYKLLFVNNPDCNACAEIKAHLVHSPRMQKIIGEGTMKVVAFYPDEDLTAWRNHMAEMPSEWINGYDPTGKVRRERLFDLRAIPTLYLLDHENRVVIKDAASVHPIELYFARIAQTE